ncbi:MAG: DUF5663 domain-containing protein [Candidatus Magasanikbacteria bacterium]
MLNQNLLEENLVTMLGIENLPDEEKSQILTKATRIAEKRIVLRVLDLLDEEKQEEFGQAVSSQDQEEIQSILQEEVDNFQELAQEEVVKVKQQLKEAVSQND